MPRNCNQSNACVTKQRKWPWPHYLVTTSSTLHFDNLFSFKRSFRKSMFIMGIICIINSPFLRGTAAWKPIKCSYNAAYVHSVFLQNSIPPLFIIITIWNMIFLFIFWLWTPSFSIFCILFQIAYFQSFSDLFLHH